MAKVNVIKIDTDPAKVSIKSLRQELKNLKNDLLSLEEGTDEYNKKLKEAGDIQHQLKETNEQVGMSAQDLGDQLGNAVKAAAGIAGGFQIAQATMSLFGAESENVGKAIQKMQNIMAITQGFRAIDNGLKSFKALGQTVKVAIQSIGLFSKTTKIAAVESKVASVNTGSLATSMAADAAATTAATTATKAFRAALISTGIGALIVGLGFAISALIENWDKLMAMLNEGLFEKGNKIKVRSVEEIGEAYDKINEKRKKEDDAYITHLKALGKTGNEIAIAQEQRDKKRWDEKYADWKREADRNEELRKISQSQMITSQKLNEYKKLAAKYGWEEVDSADELNQLYNKRVAKANDLANIADQAAAAWRESDAKVKDIQKQSTGDIKKSNEDAYKNRVDLYNAEIKLYEAKYGEEFKYTERGKKLQDEFFEYQLNHYSKNSAEYKNLLAQKLQYEKDYQEKRDAVIRAAEERLDTTGTGAKLENQIKDLQEQAEKDLSITGLTEEQKLLIRKSYESQIAELRSKAAEDQMKREIDILGKTNDYRLAQVKADATDRDTKYLKEENDLLESLNRREISYKEYSDRIAEIEAQRRAAEYSNLDNEYNINKSGIEDKMSLIDKALQTAGLDETTKQALIDSKADLNQRLLELDVEYNATIQEMRAADAAAVTEAKLKEMDEINEYITTVSATIQESLSAIASTADTDFAKISTGLSTIIGGFGEMTKDLAAGQKGWQTYGKMAATALSGVGQILTALGDKQDTSTKEGFEKQKKYQIGAATVNMLAGIVNAVVSAFSPENAWMTIAGQGAMAAAMSAIVLGMGIAQIQQIKSTQFESNGKATAQVPNMNAAALTALQGGGVQYTSDVNAEGYMSSASDSKVYVVESDIKSVGSKVNVQETENRY